MARQQPEGVVCPKILPLQQQVVAQRLERTHHLVQQRLISGATQTAPTQALIGGVVQQLLVVGAHVQAQRQARVRVHARQTGVQQYLALADGQPPRAQVAQAQHSLAVGEHHTGDQVRLGPAPQLLQHVSGVVAGDVEPLGGDGQRVILQCRVTNLRGDAAVSAEGREHTARATHRGRVDYGKQFLGIGDQ